MLKNNINEDILPSSVDIAYIRDVTLSITSSSCFNPGDVIVAVVAVVVSVAVVSPETETCCVWTSNKTNNAVCVV